MAELARKSGTKSVIWDYFGLEVGADGKPVDDGSALCRSCRKRVIAKHGNTSNLLAHLRTNHPTLHTQAKAAMEGKGKQPARKATPAPPTSSQQTLQESITVRVAYERKSAKWKELTDAVTYFIAKDSLPIFTVEKSGFKRLMRTFDPRYELPSRSYFSRTAIPALYESVRERVKQDLAEVFFFSATTDLWSSIGMRPYMSYTVHYLTDEWKLENRCLQTHFLPEDHTGENLAEAMESTLAAWDLRASRQLCLTTDNATNLINAAERLQWSHLSCFGHNLHLAITKAIKADQRCERSLALCRKIVSAFSMSWKRKRDLAKAQLNLQLPEHTLVADSPTRWGSMAKMVARIMEQENAIRTVLSADRKASHLLPTWQDLQVLTAIHKALSPLCGLTDILSGDEYVTVSAILPMLQLIETKLLKDEAGDTQLTKDIRSLIKQDLNSRYTIPKISAMVMKILQVATFLDPRFKCHFSDDLDVADIKDTLQEEGAKVLQRGAVIAQSSASESSSSSTAVAGPPPAKKRSFGSFFKDPTEEPQPVLSPEQQMKAELHAYEAMPKLDPEEDPLYWWKVQSPRFPGLRKLAQSYLSVCATSSPSERLFSTSGNIVTTQRASLKPDKVDMLVFLTKNL